MSRRWWRVGEEILATGDAERALSIFEQLAEMVPDLPAIIAGRARALIQLGRADEAQSLLDEVDADAAKDPLIAQAKAALALARDAQPVEDLAGAFGRGGVGPRTISMHASRLAGGLMAVGDSDRAADALLEIIRRDRDWNEGAARDRLLKLFEAVGLADPWVNAQRRRLSAILFA